MESSKLIVETRAQSAELTRIYDKVNGREVLWNADPAFWGWHSPVLFPFVGQCYGTQYTLNGVTRKIRQHGFARNHEFTLISETENEIWYELRDDESTRELYPCAFCLQIGYRLEEDSIHVMWKVTNPAEETMYYCIGAHPAFMIPGGFDEKLQCYIRFGGQTEIPYVTNDYKDSGCCFAGDVHTLELPDGSEQIKNLFHELDTYIFEHGEISEATILLPDRTPYVTVKCDGFPAFGFWTKKGSPFICLEPWYGRCDDIGFRGELKDKTLVQKLAGGETFSAEYVIRIH